MKKSLVVLYLFLYFFPATLVWSNSENIIYMRKYSPSDFLILQEHYTFVRNQVYAKDVFPQLEQNFLLFDIPKRLMRYQVKSANLVDIFSKNGVEVGAKSVIITFEKEIGSEMGGIKQFIYNAFMKEYNNNNIQIQSLNIDRVSNIDTRGLKIKQIIFDESLLKRDNGTFYVFFENKQNETNRIVPRKVFFRYEINATIEGVFTKTKIKGGESIGYSNTEVKTIPLKRISLDLATKDDIGKFALRSYVPEGILLTKDRLINKRIVNRGDSLVVHIFEDGVFLEFTAIAQQNGSIGDKIRVKLPNGKLYDVTITEDGVGIMK